MIQSTNRSVIFLNSLNLFKELISESMPFDTEIFTQNFAVKKYSESLDIEVNYLECVAPFEDLKFLNSKLAIFLSQWHKDKDGSDLFNHKGINLGRSFLLCIWSEVVLQTRILAAINHLNLNEDCQIKIESSMNDLKNIFIHKKLTFEEISIITKEIQLFFDVKKYMDNALSTQKKWNVTRKILLFLVNVLEDSRKKILSNKQRSAVYIQKYYPTIPIISELAKDQNYQIFTNGIIGNKGYRKYLTKQYMFAVRTVNGSSKKLAIRMVDNYRRVTQNENQNNQFFNSSDIKYIHEIISSLILNEVAIAIKSVDKILKFSQKNQLILYVSIANLGTFETVLDEYCRINRIPRFLIINGFLSGESYIDSRSADQINCYSESIRENFYLNDPKALALGDPRMDKYAHKFDFHATKSTGEKKNFVIGVGTAGYNNTDLLSYSAFEFEFIFDVLQCIQRLISSGLNKVSVKLKIRSNGFKPQYEHLINEYFNTMDIEIIENQDFFVFAHSVDAYISTYSQTLFEVASLGIPVIYFKKDKEIIDPPFDGSSEIVTSLDTDNLFASLALILADESRTYATLSKTVIEKYFGFLDGLNLERNIMHIREILVDRMVQEDD